MRYGYTLTLLLVVLGFTSVFSQTSQKAAFRFSESVKMFPNPFVDSFSIESENKFIKIEIFSLSGEKKPATIYKYHNGPKVRYETGRELRRGLYIVKLIFQDRSYHYKMIKLQ